MLVQSAWGANCLCFACYASFTSRVSCSTCLSRCYNRNKWQSLLPLMIYKRVTLPRIDMFGNLSTVCLGFVPFTLNCRRLCRYLINLWRLGLFSSHSNSTLKSQQQICFVDLVRALCIFRRQQVYQIQSVSPIPPQPPTPKTYDRALVLWTRKRRHTGCVCISE